MRSFYSKQHYQEIDESKNKQRPSDRRSHMGLSEYEGTNEIPRSSQMKDDCQHFQHVPNRVEDPTDTRKTLETEAKLRDEKNKPDIKDHQMDTHKGGYDL